jgi:hypothetical protein
MEACVDLYRGPRHSLGNPPVVGFSLGLGCVPGESPDAGQLSGTPLCVGSASLFEFQGSITFPISSSPATKARAQTG